MTKLNKIAMALNLDRRDVLHNEVANDLQENRDAHHDVADVVQEEEPDVVRIGIKHEHRYADRNATESDTGHPPMRPEGADAPPYFEPPPNPEGRFVRG